MGQQCDEVWDNVPVRRRRMFIEVKRGVEKSEKKTKRMDEKKEK